MNHIRETFSGFKGAATASGLLTFLLLGTAWPVQAMGYASVTCEELHQHKDQIYYDNGFCIPDSEAAARGDKAKCTVQKLSEASFSNLDMQNLMLIARNEIKKKCPKASPAPMADPFEK